MLVFFLVSPPPPPFFDLYENRRYFSFPTFSPASSPNLLLHFSSFPLILSFTASSFLFPPSIFKYLSIIHFTFYMYFNFFWTPSLPIPVSFLFLLFSISISLVFHRTGASFFDFSTCLDRPFSLLLLNSDFYCIPRIYGFVGCLNIINSCLIYPFLLGLKLCLWTYLSLMATTRTGI